jgi:predicted nucleic-acid-binding protein
MKIAADTNILLRNVLQDDPIQSHVSRKELENAELVAISTPVFCEFVWVLRHLYRKSALEVASAIRFLIDSENVVTDRETVEAGLTILDAGGDFADGAIAYEGAWLGAEEFVSFDKQAVTLLKSQGRKARLLFR